MTFENLTVAENFIDPDSKLSGPKDQKNNKKRLVGFIWKCEEQFRPAQQPGNTTAIGVGAQALLIAPLSYTATRDPPPNHSGDSVPWGRASSSASCWDLSCWAGTAGSGSCPRGQAAGWEGSWGSPGNTGAAHLSPATHTDRSARDRDRKCRRPKTRVSKTHLSLPLLSHVSINEAGGELLRETQHCNKWCHRV